MKQHILTIIVAVLVLIAIGFLSALLWPDTEDSPWYPNQYTTPEKALAELHPNADPNDPNFLRDYRKYMGHDFH